MAEVDDRSANYDWPLPNPNNELAEDAVRIKDALIGADAAVRENAQTLTGQGQAIGTLEQTVVSQGQSLTSQEQAINSLTETQNSQGQQLAAIEQSIGDVGSILDEINGEVV